MGEDDYTFDFELTEQQRATADAFINRSLAPPLDLLQSSVEMFKEGSDGGRRGAAAQLTIISMYMKTWIQEDALLAPLKVVINALMALDENNVLPIMQPIPRAAGRAHGSFLRGMIQALTLDTAERLRAINFAGTTADKMVAMELRKAGVKPARGNGVISVRTIRKWRELLSEKGHGEADVVYFIRSYRKSRNDYGDLAQALAAKHLLERLSGELSQIRAADIR